MKKKNKKNKNKYNKQNEATAVVAFQTSSALEALKGFKKAYAMECAKRNIQKTDEGYCNYLRACFIYMNAENETCILKHDLISEYFACVSMDPETMEIAKEVEKTFGSIFSENGIKLNDDNVLHLWEALVLEANLNKDAHRLVAQDILARFRELLYV